jgi:hypothetical protein
MSLFGLDGIGGSLLSSFIGGEFSLGGGGGLIPDATAYQMGAQGGNTLIGLTANTPLASLPSPANMDPAVSIFGMKKGPIGILGGFMEDTADTVLPIAGQIVGGIVGAYFGSPELGAKAGRSIGEAAAGTVDTTSDAGIGIFDLDGKESKDQQDPLVTWWRA